MIKKALYIALSLLLVPELGLANSNGDAAVDKVVCIEDLDQLPEGSSQLMRVTNENGSVSFHYWMYQNDDRPREWVLGKDKEYDPRSLDPENYAKYAEHMQFSSDARIWGRRTSLGILSIVGFGKASLVRKGMAKTVSRTATGKKVILWLLNGAFGWEAGTSAMGAAQDLNETYDPGWGWLSPYIAFALGIGIGDEYNLSNLALDVDKHLNVDLLMTNGLSLEEFNAGLQRLGPDNRVNHLIGNDVCVWGESGPAARELNKIRRYLGNLLMGVEHSWKAPEDHRSFSEEMGIMP